MTVVQTRVVSLLQVYRQRSLHSQPAWFLTVQGPEHNLLAKWTSHPPELPQIHFVNGSLIYFVTGP